MLKNSLYIVVASLIFFMGYVTKSMVEAYETRPNQYPPYGKEVVDVNGCLLYTSPSPRDLSTSRMPSSA